MSSDQGTLLDMPAIAKTVRLGSTSSDLASEKRPANVVRVGVIGYGYWGPNIVRNLQGLEDCQLVAVCDKNPAALKRAQRACPGVHLTTDFSEVHQIARRGRHRCGHHSGVGPTSTWRRRHWRTASTYSSRSRSPRRRSKPRSLLSWRRARLKIMVDHTFLFSGAVRKIREVIERRDAGPALLLRFDSREPRAFSTRRQRGVGILRHTICRSWTTLSPSSPRRW